MFRKVGIAAATALAVVAFSGTADAQHRHRHHHHHHHGHGWVGPAIVGGLALGALAATAPRCWIEERFFVDRRGRERVRRVQVCR